MILTMQYIYSQQVMVSGGTHAIGSDVQLSWTVGETIIETFTGSTTILTQGFNQGSLKITAIEPFDLLGITVAVFPNPVNEKLSIKINNFTENKYNYAMIDINSRLILNGIVLSNPQIIDLNVVSPGLYFLKIGISGANYYQTFKIIKQ